MFEQNFEHEDRYVQQGRRGNSPYYDRRSSTRGYQPEEDRFESDRYRYRGQDSYRGDQDRRYTRPDYDSDLDIERPGQARFGSRGSYGSNNDYSSYGSTDFGVGREYQGSSYNRQGRSGRSQDRFEPSSRDSQGYGLGSGYESNRFDSQRSDYGRQSQGNYGYDQNRDWQNSSIGHADWNARGDWNRSSSHDQSGYRGSSDHQSSLNDKNRWPKSYKRSDDRLKDDIHEELIRHGRIDASDIEVEVKDGEVTLTGQVGSRQDKRIAEDLAEKVLGVHEVQNQLRVKQQQNQGQGQSQSFGQDQQRSGSPSLPGSNRTSSLGQQDSSKAANSSSK